MTIKQIVMPLANEAWNAELIAVRRKNMTAESKSTQMNILKEKS
jgi:hypothetical protein